MKLLIILSLVSIVLPFILVDKPQLSGKPLEDYVHSVQSSFKIAPITDKKMKRSMDMKYASFGDAEIRTTIADSIPDSFDARTQWPNCPTIGQVHNQGGCLSGWAISAVNVMSDRICIQSNGALKPNISTDNVLSCCSSSCGEACDGGHPIQAFRYWMSKGIVTGGDYHGGGCRPYQFKPCEDPEYLCEKEHQPWCFTSCQDGYTVAYATDKHFGASAYAILTVAAIQTEIMTNGPVEATLQTYEDFDAYHSGIYKHTAGTFQGTQAVRLVGWGTENGVAYWIGVNSWGTKWGESGTFRIRLGHDECSIESGVVAGMPKL